MTAVPAAVREAVRGAWASCLRRDPAPDVTFSEAGGDSLAALGFVHLLGRAVGSDLPLDVLGMDDTADDVGAVVALLLGRGGPAPAPPAPRLLLVTGAYGDEPALAGLRRRQDGVDVATVEPPGVRAADATLSSMARMAEAVVDAAPAGGPVHLAGFSFGGALAAEAALVLEGSGRTVASLSLIDVPYSRDAMRFNLWHGRGLAERASWSLQTMPGRWGPSRVAFAGIASRLFPGAAAAHAVRRRMLDGPRRRALSGWRPALPDVPTLVVLGEGLGTANAADWERAAPCARHLRLRGGHGDVLGPGNVDIVAAAMASVMASLTSP